MKTKALKDLKNKSIDELKVAILDAKKELSDLMFEKMQNKLKNTSSILHKRKDLARMLTVLSEKIVSLKEEAVAVKAK